MKNRIRTPKSTMLFYVFGYAITAVFGLFCILPFILMVSGSFTSEQSIFTNGYSLVPAEFSLAAYEMLFKYPMDVMKAYAVSIFVTATGTVLGLFLVTMTAYVLSRPDFKYRNKIAFFFYFTTLFNGGIVPLYIMMVRYLGLKNSYFALILPILMNVFHIIVMRSFLSSIPISISESAKIDGAGDFRIFISLILPLAKSALATIGLFIALGYWNDWYNAMLYISDRSRFPLQYMLYNMFNAAEAIGRVASQINVPIQRMPQESFKMAMAVVATGPIVLLYPFVQKYFVKGVTVGAVKG